VRGCQGATEQKRTSKREREDEREQESVRERARQSERERRTLCKEEIPPPTRIKLYACKYMHTCAPTLKQHVQTTNTCKLPGMFSPLNFEPGWCTELRQDPTILELGKVCQDKIEELACKLVPILANIRYRLSMSLRVRETKCACTRE